MVEQGICLIAMGSHTHSAALECIRSIRKQHKHLPINVYTDKALSDETVTYHVDMLPHDDMRKASRILKTNLDLMTPFKRTLYIDVDCRVHAPLDLYFDVLKAGFEWVMCPSTVQGDKWAATINPQEVEATLDCLGFQPFQYQCGVFSMRRTAGVRALFAAWRKEYSRFSELDQLAFSRALYQKPVKMCLLDGRVFNNGSVISHHFGSLR